MKIRKVFENLDGYYSEIPEHEFYGDEFDEGKYRPLSKNEMEEVMVEFPFLCKSPLNDEYKSEKYRLYVNKMDGVSKSQKTSQNYFVDKNIIGGIITFYVMEDDWYNIRIAYTESKNQTLDEYEKFFKCDQFDGLIKCLSDEFLNNED